MDKKALLHVDNLNVGFQTADGFSPAVTGISFEIEEGESVALVGESGCGKSVTALSILRLLDCPPTVISADSMLYGGRDIMRLTEREMLSIRGNEIGMIFQEPMTSLNPILTIGYQVGEALRIHRNISKKEATEQSVQLLASVGIPDARLRAREYPHQMSGGMRQRAMIALALSCEPRLLIADEPTTALDVTIQAQILRLIAQIQRKQQMALLLITHNLGIVAQVADRVMVMYAGQIVEIANTDSIFDCPTHPYTVGLLRSIPSAANKVERLNVIKGVVPSPMFYPQGCRFSPRCPYVRKRCAEEQPQLTAVEDGHFCRCHFPLAEGGEALV
jgi:oligopeptide/dipeptide ABC transporter ATP-binding protein